MICKLYPETPEDGGNALYRVLMDRGLNFEQTKELINASWDNVNSPDLLDNIEQAANGLRIAIKQNKKMLVIVDCDCDGFTSAALFINFIGTLYPNYNIDYIMHEGKQHGLNDLPLDKLKEYEVIFIPDAASNDYERHKILYDAGIPIYILDHHEADLVSQYAIIVNNQLCDYPNKQLSGVGIVWQFCRKYLEMYEPDKINLAYQFLDLVATGVMGDMQSLLVPETKFLIWTGFKEENIHNPFIAGMIEKNKFPMTKPKYISYRGLACSPMGAAFFIIPFINAINRSGTMAEKELIFKAMMPKYAFEEVLSTKRGHKVGETERIIDQALRTVTNVKNRQTKAEETGMALLDKKVQEDNMLQSPTLIFKLEPGQIDPGIAGLVANKLAAKYQRPTLVLTRVNGINSETNQIENYYTGSGRGYSNTGSIDFKQMCADTGLTQFVAGHPSAFGASINEKVFDDFRTALNHEFDTELSSEKIYYVDYSYKDDDPSEKMSRQIIDIAEMNDWWGKDINRALVSIEFTCSPSQFKVMASNTLKFTLKNGINIIKFSGEDSEIELFSNKVVKVLAVCECNKNEWNGNISAQLMLTDYEIKGFHDYF